MSTCPPLVLGALEDDCLRWWLLPGLAWGVQVAVRCCCQLLPDLASVVQAAAAAPVAQGDLNWRWPLTLAAQSVVRAGACWCWRLTPAAELVAQAGAHCY